MQHPAPRYLLTICAFATLSALVGCSRQKEGERCSPTNSNSDCEDDLVCAELSDRDGTAFYLCCPEDEQSATDARCKSGNVVGDGDASGLGGLGGMMSSEDVPKSFGENCVYNHDCIAPLVCVSGGKCNYECEQDVDCDAGETCSDDKLCVAD